MATTGRNDLSDLLSITGSLLPGIMRSRDRAAAEIEKQALNKANERRNEYARNVVLNQNDLILENFEDQGMVADARDNMTRTVDEIRDKRKLAGEKAFTDLQLSESEAFLESYVKWNQAHKQANPQNKRQIEFAIMQQRDDDLQMGILTAEEINSLTNAALGHVQKSKTIGVADQNALITKETVLQRHGRNGLNAFNVAQDIIVAKEARAIGVPLDELTTANVRQYESTLMVQLRGLGFEKVRTATITRHTGGTNARTLKGDQIDLVNQELDELEIGFLGHIDSMIARDVKRGGGQMDEDTLERIRKNIRDSVQNERDFYASHTELAQLKTMNEFSRELMKNGAGDAYEHVRKFVTLGGVEAQNAYVGTMTLTGKPQELAEATLQKLIPGMDISNLSTILAGVYTDIGNPVPNPSTASLSVPFAIQILQGPGTDSKDVVTHHAITGVSGLTMNVFDIKEAIKLWTNPNTAAKINNGDASVKRAFVTAHNADMKKILNDIQVQNFKLEWLPDLNRFKVDKIIKYKRTNADLNNGVPAGTTALEVNKVAQTAINNIYSKLIEPGLYPGILPEPNKFLKDLATASGDLGLTYVHPTHSPSLLQLEVRSGGGQADPAGTAVADTLSGDNRDLFELINLYKDPSKQQAFLDKIEEHERLQQLPPDYKTRSNATPQQKKNLRAFTE